MVMDLMYETADRVTANDIARRNLRVVEKLEESKEPELEPEPEVSAEPRPSLFSRKYWQNRGMRPEVKQAISTTAEVGQQVIKATADATGQALEGAVDLGKKTARPALLATALAGAAKMDRPPIDLPSIHVEVPDIKGNNLVYIQDARSKVSDEGITITQVNQQIKPPAELATQPQIKQPEYKVDPSLSIEDNMIKNQTEALVAAIPDYAGFPNIHEDARVAIPLLIKALRKEGYTSNEAIAFTIGNTEDECKFDPGKEIDAETQAAINDYEGGDKYAGWGYIQLTGFPNYKFMQEKTGLPLVEHPELAGVPENAARILAIFYKENGTGRFAEQGEFLKARATINSGEVRSSDARIKNTPYSIKNKAEKYLDILNRLGD